MTWSREFMIFVRIFVGEIAKYLMTNSIGYSSRLLVIEGLIFFCVFSTIILAKFPYIILSHQSDKSISLQLVFLLATIQCHQNLSRLSTP